VSANAWDAPGWLERATEWIDEHVERTGPVELVLARVWSAVARVPTVEGTAWFKEVPPSLAFEPPLTALLAARRPDRLPETVAVDGLRLLTRDAGRRLRAQLDDGGTAPSWQELLALQAELQLDFAPLADEALVLGTPDARPELLTKLAAELPGGEKRAETVRRAVEGLGDAVPVSVVHTEAHDGNLFVRDGQVRVLDWAEALVSHPFVGTVLPLRFAAERLGAAPGSPEVERLRDAYLEPFTRCAPLPELREQFGHGYLLGTLVRAVAWHIVLASQPQERAAELGNPVAAWLGLLDGVADGTVSLGDA
jgi:hypothetical protein